MPRARDRGRPGWQAGSGGRGLLGRRGAVQGQCGRRTWALPRASPSASGLPGRAGGRLRSPGPGCCFEDAETRTPAAVLLADTEAWDCARPPATCSAAWARPPARPAGPGQAGHIVAEAEPPQRPAGAGQAMPRPPGRGARSPPSPGAGDTPAERELGAQEGTRVALQGTRRSPAPGRFHCRPAACPCPSSLSRRKQW